MRLVLLALAAALSAAPAHAQRLANTFPVSEATMAAAFAVPAGQAPPDSASRRFNRSDRFIVRAGLSGVGMVGGAFAVGLASYFIFPHCNACEDPGLSGLVLGGLTGAVLGTAVFGSLPAMGDGCTYYDRFGRALLGAGAGTAVGLLGAWATGVPLVVPVGAAGGSAFGTLGCRAKAERAEVR
jgi:hypothetical protein